MKVCVKKEVSRSREQCMRPTGKLKRASLNKKKKKVKRKTLGFHLSKGILKQHLDSGCVFSSLFFTEKRSITSVSGFHTLCTGTHYLLTSKISGGQCFLVGPMHRSRDSQTSFFTQTFIKNWSHDIIHTFKNYFTTVFLVFNFQQISGIQTHSNSKMKLHCEKDRSYTFTSKSHLEHLQ